MLGTPLVAPLEQSTLQNATVAALGPCSAVIKRYKIVTMALRGLGRHHFVMGIAVIVAVIVLCVGSQAFAGMENNVSVETRFYVGTKKVKLL